MEDGFRQLAKLEPRFGTVLRRHGEPPSRQRRGGFETVLKIIVQQQVSLASADAIWRRLRRGLRTANPDAVLAMDEATLRGFGLSRQKAAYAHSLAEAVASGALNFRKLRGLADEAVIDDLVQIKGIGRWTAEIYLLAVMQRPDIWPAADVALMEGARDLLDLPERPNIKEMGPLAEPWRPFRTFAARVIWLHYRHMTKRDTAG
ncbi:MAG: DNA-3-methyladenine glycosylase 2 family protein [Rhodospirillaceae bacterium]|jgi:DNA-3-methyladenine glycosylase II|nr:DNA-3-methyladenine glycosylase 2 family protein [Rhodospirillaceae bacterium]MBT4487188.1 DNA-3-methyladenine glycosylase 2 family protein [Rhodospirillaceae bacterium]MBT5194406.1 DNA-3-methyladenine glycosylase 2 family protein [Rhodospirillaceae bacterium]MBT5894882.1 DNA-3-methyladenine glycosylase 2 family protein [Rhodospirillaceae bacterium]MBT6431434.1 DNA-3-methyladenine glycosylase 2 family protein [Rhodospirillaceae bacterium]